MGLNKKYNSTKNRKNSLRKSMKHLKRSMNKAKWLSMEAQIN